MGDVITRFVGHFLDVRKDQLRVSLWSGKTTQSTSSTESLNMPMLGKRRPHVLLHAGWSTGLTLENVRLKVEAFEYLQLPFNITEGRIGRLILQVCHAAHATISASQRHRIQHDLAGAHRNQGNHSPV